MVKVTFSPSISLDEPKKNVISDLISNWMVKLNFNKALLNIDSCVRPELILKDKEINDQNPRPSTI